MRSEKGSGLFASNDRASGLPTVSIAMATYNGENYIREQLASLAAQTVLPCEVVVTDDGSTDQTLAVIADFARTAPFPVRVYPCEKRLGFANNFLRAASLCEGELISFCDQDDVWMKEKIELCSKEFYDPDVLLCLHSSKIWNGSDAFLGSWPDFKSRVVYAPVSVDPLTVYPGFSMTIRRSLLNISDNNVRPNNLHSLTTSPAPMSHDQWVWFLASTFGKIVTIPDALVLYRQHDRNVYGASFKRDIWQSLRLSVAKIDYEKLATLEAECSVMLDRMSTELSGSYQFRASEASNLLRKRATLKKKRARIYAERSNVVGRIFAYCSILFRGGYYADCYNLGLGYRAAIKDAVFGTSGFYKLHFFRS